MPKFSIIVGLYNQSDTLPALIDSLNRQSFQDFEVHFCDDGSDDINVLKMLESYDTDHLKFKWYYHRQDHKGMRLAKNVNHGIRAAKGEYCVLVMADSILELDYLERLTEWAAPDRIVCGIRIQIAMINGKLEGVDIDWRMKKQAIPEMASVIIDSPWLALTGNGLTIPTEAFRMYGPLSKELEGYGGEDNDIVARLYYQGYLCWSVPELRLYHMWHISKDSLPENARIVHQKVQSYARAR